MNTDDNNIQRKKNCSTLNKQEKLILFLGTAELCFAIAISIYNLATQNYDEFNEKNIFPMIVIICSIFTFFYLYRGIFAERSYELMIYIISAVCLTCYIVINFVYEIDRTKQIQKIFIIRLAVVIMILPVTSVIGTLLAFNYNIRGNLLFYTVGGCEQIQDHCKNLYVFEALMQLDFQFELCMVILSMTQFLQFATYAKFILAFGVPFSIIWRFIGFYSMRNEIKIGSYLFFLFGFLEPANIIYIIYNTIKNILNACETPIRTPVIPIVSITFVCCLLGLLIRSLVLTMNIVVHKKFGNGLKEKINGSCNIVRAEDDETNPLLSASDRSEEAGNT